MVETALDWTVAEERLNGLIDRYLHNGSLGVSGFMEHIYPLRNRFKAGERTPELYNDILNAPEP